MTTRDNGLHSMLRDVAPALAGVLGAVSYLIKISRYYDWWVVVIVSPIALFVSLIVFGFLWITAESWFSRIVWFTLGAGCLYQGFTTEADRTEAMLADAALLLVSVFSMRPGDGSRG